jgi:hypothetical protein
VVGAEWQGADWIEHDAAVPLGIEQEAPLAPCSWSQSQSAGGQRHEAPTFVLGVTSIRTDESAGVRRKRGNTAHSTRRKRMPRILRFAATPCQPIVVISISSTPGLHGSPLARMTVLPRDGVAVRQAGGEREAERAGWLGVGVDVADARVRLARQAWAIRIRPGAGRSVRPP